MPTFPLHTFDRHSASRASNLWGPIMSVAACCAILTGAATNAHASIPTDARWSGSHIPIDPDVPAYCEAYYGPTGDPFFLEVDLVVRDPSGSIVAGDTGSGWYYAEVSVQTSLTETGNWHCEADYYMDGTPMGSDSASLPWYLLMLDITINTFIPDDHYPCPSYTPCYWYGERGWTGTGDDRSWNRYGSSRTTQIVAILQPRSSAYLIDGAPMYDVGRSETYDIDTSVDGGFRLTSEARNDWTWGYPMKLEWGYPSGATLQCNTTGNSAVNMELHCQGNEATPLIWYAPGITYDFYIDFWFHADDANESIRVEYLVRGSHDGFPNYEIYVGNQLIYSHDYVAHGQSIASLGPPAEFAGLFVPGEVW
jgi:hypothetical protein